MPTRRELLWTAAALASASMLPGFAAAAPPAGSVVALTGEGFVEAQGQRSALKIGASINVGATIDVPANGKLKLRMSDGSVLALASGTQLTIAAYQTDAAGQRQDAKLSLAQGLLRAMVTPVQQPAAFEVSTPVGVVAVRSPECFIEVKPGSVQVGVLAGSVILTSSATGRTVTVPARWGARLEAGHDPVPGRVWSPPEFEAVIARTDVN